MKTTFGKLTPLFSYSYIKRDTSTFLGIFKGFVFD